MPLQSILPRDSELRLFLEVAIQAAERAGRIQKAALDKPHRIIFKGETNLVTEVDRACEAIIVRTIRSSFPEHDFLLEESHIPRQGSPYLWNIDPLDGTTNYSHRFPYFSCSIALEYKGSPLVGVVLDPIRRERFTAIRSRGAYLNGTRIRVSRESRLIRCLLATAFPYDIRLARDKNLKKFSRMVRRVQSIRRSGSAALDICYVAAGRLDGYWSTQLERWDAAAGILIVQEAGGCVTDLYGNAPDDTTRNLVATNGRIHKELFRFLHGNGNAHQ